MQNSKVIAAVRNGEELNIALNSNVSTIFMLGSNIEEIKRQIDLTHQNNKTIFIHLDLLEGVGKDEYGIRFLKNLGIDGIISTRTNLIKIAKKEGLKTVQRFFIVDSHSIQTTLDSLSSSKADMIEIMPGTLDKIINKLSKEIKVPIVAGGLIETKDEIFKATKNGAFAVSTGKSNLWE